VNFNLKASQTSPSKIKTINDLLEIESIDFFVRLMSILGLPRSVGEIYGLLYFSETALSMNKIANRLGISIGSASQGLKTLKSLKAIKSTYIAGDRKDHYLAEIEFRKLFSTFIKDEIMPHLESAKERISKMENSLSPQEKEDEFYAVRVEKLKKLAKTGSRLLPAIAGILNLK
jgi:DNA-binding transcriptional regulator GbsR (MarR family)